MSRDYLNKSNFTPQIAVSSAFQKVKPICLKLLSNCKANDFDQLIAILQELDTESLNLLQAYLVFPAYFIMRKKINENLTMKCVQFMTYLFNRSPVQTFSTFSDIFRELFTSISVIGEVEKISDCSEEYKISVCQCTVSLIQNSKEEIINEMYGLEFRLALAHALFVFTQLVKTEKSKQLRNSVLEALGALCYNEHYLKDKYDSSEKIASVALAPYFPGITITLQTVICGDFKQGHQVICHSLKILGDIIVLVVGDQCQVDIVKNNKSKSEFSSVSNIIKDTTWFKNVSDKMKILLENVVMVAHHDHWKVRLEFLKFVKILLFNCTKHLNDSVSILMPSVMALYVDDHPEITANMQTFVPVLSAKLQESNSTSLRSVVEDNIYATTSKLIKCKLLANDKIKLFTLRTLQGYLSVLESSISCVLSSLPHFERVMLSLINFIEFDTTALNIIEEVPTSQFDANSPNLWPKKNFICFQDDEILRTISSVIYLLTKFDHARLLIHYLLEKMESSSLYNLQCIYLTGEIVKSLRHDSKYSEQNILLINDILDELLSPKIWEVPLLDVNQQVVSKRPEVPENSVVLPPKLYNNNVFQICLILEVIAKCAEVLKGDFKSFLLKSLSSVMEKAGSSNYMISQSGRLCLYSISQFCNYNSVFELIKDNADYITNSITINFHHFLYKPEVAIVLRVAMEESDATGLTLFRDAIYQILKLIDLNQDRSYSLLNILFCAVNCIEKWYPPKKILKPNISSRKAEDLVTRISEYRALKIVDFDSISCDKEEGDDSSNVLCEEVDDSFEVNDKKVLPLHISTVTDIFKRCIHFQSSKNLYLRMLALEMAEACVTALSDFEHELHPLVHEFWSPFVQRFSEDTVIVSKAFQVLLVIVDECRDFVLVRTLKDVMPRLINMLKHEYKNSLKSNFRNYQWVNAHKLQLLVLSEIGNLCSKLQVSEKDLASVTEVCLPYLNILQPKVLQSAAEKTLKSLAAVNGDAVWFYYNEMYSTEKFINPPHPSLNVICFPNSTGSDTNIRIDFH